MLRKLAFAITAAAVLLLFVPAAALAANSFNQVLDNVRIWLSGLFAGVATLFLMVSGARYLSAGGDPVQVERAKHAIRAALAGYALVLLAPVLVGLVRRMIG